MILLNVTKIQKKLMPFVHLPIQSGSDKILKMMNRKHTVNYYLNIYEKLIKINPDIKFSSDFIIGYPGETENDFKETINLVNKIKFINSFSFIFSPRPGTKAAELEITDKDKIKNRLITIQENLFLPKYLFWFLSLFSTSTSKVFPSKDLFNSI